jgi:hypothetical protein
MVGLYSSGTVLRSDLTARVKGNQKALVMGIPVIHTGPDAGRKDNTGPKAAGSMTVDEFYAFTDTRPDEEKWELIEGEPVLKAPPLDVHAWIVRNVIFALMTREREINAPWVAVADLGVRISEKSRPEPDILVYPCEHRRPEGRRDRDDVTVVFEVLSPSTEDHDLAGSGRPTPVLRRSPITS